MSVSSLRVCLEAFALVVLSRFHRDLTRLRRLRLGYPNRQHPGLVSGGRLVEIEFVRKLDGTGELTERSFAPVVPCGVTNRLALALTLDCQGVTLSGDVEACWIHPGYLGHYHDSVPVIEYVHRGKSPGPETPSLIAGLRRKRSNSVCNVSRLLTGSRSDENLSGAIRASLRLSIGET